MAFPIVCYLKVHLDPSENTKNVCYSRMNLFLRMENGILMIQNDTNNCKQNWKLLSKKKNLIWIASQTTYNMS